MASNLITNPYTIMLNPTGGGGRVKPIANGKFFYGEIDKDPQTNPIQVYYKDETQQEIPISQPIRTNNSGAFVNGQVLITPYTKEVGHSTLCLDQNGQVIYRDLHVGDPGNIAEILPSYTDLVFDSVADAIKVPNSKGLRLKVGDLISTDDYYGSPSPNNSGRLFFKVVPPGTGTADGGKYIDASDNSFQLEQNLRVPLDVKAFGGVGDGATDDTSSFSSLINYAQSPTRSIEIHLSDGLYEIDSDSLPTITKSIRFTGSGVRNCVLLMSGSKGLVVSGASTGARATDVTIENLSLNGFNMTAGYCLTIDYTQSTHLTNVSVFDPFNGINLRQTGNCTSNNVQVDGTVRGQYGLYAYGGNIPRNGENDQIDVIQFNNCLFQSTYDGSETIPTGELFVLDGRVHSVQINGVRCLSGLRGFVARNSPGLDLEFTPRFIKGSGLESENTYAEGILFSEADAVELSDVFQARAFRASGVVVGAACGSINLTTGNVGTNYNHGINNQGCTSLTLVDVMSRNNSLEVGNTYSGLFIGGAGRTKVRGGLLGKEESRTYTENQKYGVELDSGFTGEIQASGVNLNGNATGPFGYAGTANQYSYARGCSGYNPGGTSFLNVPDSGQSIGVSIRDRALGFNGGTGVVITVDGVGFAIAEQGSFFLGAMQDATITYLTKPTISMSIL